jgi:uncharacterized RDD family membrane protein YckC
VDEPTPALEPPIKHRAAPGLLVASLLCWIFGVTVALVAAAVLWIGTMVPGIGFGFAPWSVLMLALAGAYCTAGYFLRKSQRTGGWIAVIAVGAAVAIRPLPQSQLTPLAVIINVIMLLLLLRNWSSLTGRERQVGA